MKNSQAPNTPYNVWEYKLSNSLSKKILRITIIYIYIFVIKKMSALILELSFCNRRKCNPCIFED